MTVPTTTNKVIGEGDGLATVFPFTFGTLPSGDLVVTLFDTIGTPILQTEFTNYTVLGKGAEDGGSVVFVVPPPAGYTVLIQRILSTAQPDDLKNQGSYYPRTVERMFDRRAMVDQQLEETISRTLTLPPQVQGVSTVLPSPLPLNLIGWDTTGEALRNFTAGDIGTTLAFSNFIPDRFTAVAAQVNFTLTADPGAIGNLDVSIDGVTQRPFDDYTYIGNTLTFVTPMAGGEKVLVRYGTALPTGITDSNAILYTPPSTGILGTMKSFLDALWATGANAGAKLIRWIQAGAGAIARTVEAKLRERYSLHDVLTDAEIADSQTGSPVIDIAAKVQLALDNNRGKLYIPAGTYRSSPVAMTSSVVIQGDGSAVDTGAKSTRILVPGTGADWLVVDSHNPSTIRDLAIMGELTAVAGSGVTLKCTTPFLGTVNKFSLIENVRFENCFIGINALQASSWTARGCVLWNIPANGFGMLVNNSFNEDQGDQLIDGNTFGGATSALGIAWTGGGGTKIVNNKSFMAQFLYADLTQTVGGETAQFIVSNNSIDVPVSPGGAGVHPMSFQMVGGVTAFENITVSDNLCIGYFAMAEMLSIRGAAAAKIRNVNITDNVLVNPTGSFTGLGMVFLDYVDGFNLSGNIIRGPGSSTGVNVTANCTDGSIDGTNLIRGFTNAIANASTSTAVRRRSDSGVASAVSDGGVITHKLGVAPTKVFVTGNVAAQTYVPFSATSTQFQVAVRNTAGASGSASNIFWAVEE